MATPNARGAYDLLWRAMQQHALQQRRDDSSPTSFGAPEYDPDGYGSPQGGLLGRLLGLQAEQNPYQLPANNNRAAPSVSADPNFRQLSRMPSANRSQGGAVAPTEAVDQPGPTFSPGAAASPGWSSTAEQGAGLFGTYGNKPVAPWMVGLPTMMPSPVGFRIGGMPMPGPIPVPPGHLPQIPMPAIPEAWKSAAPFLKLFPSILSEQLGHQMASGKGAEEDDEDREFNWDEWSQRNQKRLADQRRARDEAGRKAIAASGPDPGNYCTNRYNDEMKRCYQRSQDYPHWDYLSACEKRAADRLGKCSKKGEPDPTELPEWGPDEEETFRNFNR